MFSPHRNAGFTIVELLAVLLIIGILSGVATPRLLKGASGADLEATVSHLKTIVLAAEIYYNDHGAWPDGQLEGLMHEDFEGYLRPNLFAVPCPIGGVYDWDENTRGVVAAMTIYDENPTRSLWREIDSRLDDGNLSTGNVRSMDEGDAQLLRWILEE